MCHAERHYPPPRLFMSLLTSNKIQLFVISVNCGKCQKIWKIFQDSLKRHMPEVRLAEAQMLS